MKQGIILNIGQKVGDSVSTTGWIPAKIGSGYEQRGELLTGTIQSMEVIKAYGCSASWLSVLLDPSPPLGLPCDAYDDPQLEPDYILEDPACRGSITVTPYDCLITIPEDYDGYDDEERRYQEIVEEEEAAKRPPEMDSPCREAIKWSGGKSGILCPICNCYH
jgi:hypothetical protein